MIIGMPFERKDLETRICIIPRLAKKLVSQGHNVLIERNAGLGAGFPDSEYKKIGAKIVSRNEIYENSEFVVKWKDLLPIEYDVPLQKDQIFIACHHLGENEQVPKVVELLKKSKVKALSWELIKLPNGVRPAVKYMSELAGAMAPLLATTFIQKSYGGSGVSLVAVRGHRKPKIVIIGGGNAGFAAAKVCRGFGADVDIFEIENDRIDFLSMVLPEMNVLPYSQDEVAKSVIEADALINTIYPDPVKGEWLVTRKTVKSMKKGSVIIDLVGCGGIETTTHFTTVSNPIYIEEGVVHCAIDYMPSMLPETAVKIIDHTCGKYIDLIANKGLKQACYDCEELLASVSIVNGKIVHPDIAITHGVDCHPLDLELL